MVLSIFYFVSIYELNAQKNVAKKCKSIFMNRVFICCRFFSSHSPDFNLLNGWNHWKRSFDLWLWEFKPGYCFVIFFSWLWLWTGLRMMWHSKSVKFKANLEQLNQQSFYHTINALEIIFSSWNQHDDCMICNKPSENKKERNRFCTYAQRIVKRNDFLEYTIFSSKNVRKKLICANDLLCIEHTEC